jgi:predicted NBD/HSP70 family sugar kinase
LVKSYGAEPTALLAHGVILQLAWPVPHELDGRDCWCGRTGCLDCFLSLGGLETEYHNITQTRLDIKAIAAAADASDLVASSVLQVLDDRIGRTTAMIINMFDPDVIFLGGRLAGLDRLYQNVPRKWPGYLLVERNEDEIAKSQSRCVYSGQRRSLSCHRPSHLAITPSIAIAINN